MGNSSARRHLLTFWVRPAETFRAIAAEQRISWLLPLLFVSVCLLFRVFALGSLKLNAGTTIQIPTDFQYYLPEEQVRLQEALAIGNGPLFVFVFPAIGSLGALWIEWFLLSAFLTVSLRLGRAKIHGGKIRPVVAWAYLPIGLRFLIQAIYILAAQKEIQQTGLASLLSSLPGEPLSLPGLILSAVDLYLFWQIMLLCRGSRIVTGLPLWKVVPPVFFAVGLLLVLNGLAAASAGMLNSVLSG